MAGYNLTRSVEELLDRTESSPPSFTIYLYSDYWTLNSGSKFLYNNQVASLLDDIRAHRIPVDFLELFDAAKVPFYDGCMIVELLDYRPQRNKEPVPERPERTRVVLHPNGETLWADICLLNQKAGNKWTDNDALEIESRLLLATAPPLCLDPDPHLTRIANHVLRVSTPTVPVFLKRKAAALDPEEDETDKARRAKIMQFMNPRPNRSHVPSYRILDAIQRNKMQKEGMLKEAMPPPTAPQPSTQAMPPPVVQPVPPVQPPAPQPTPVPSTPQETHTSPSLDDSAKKKLKAKKKGDSSQSPYNVADKGNDTNTPVPQTNGGQFQQQNQLAQRSPRPVPQSPLQPPTYAAVQASADPGKRGPSPAQHHFPNQPPPVSRNGQTKHPANPPQPTTQQTNMANPQIQQLYAQYQLQHAAAAVQQQRLNAQASNGRSTPQGPPMSRSPLNPNQGAARKSPSQALPSRSPMIPSKQPTPQMTHPQHISFSVAPNQYNPPHMRMVHPNGSTHPQTLSTHLVSTSAQASPSPAPSGQQQTSSQDQAHPPQQSMVAQYPTHMFSYPQMGMNYAMQPRGVPPGYPWPMGIGRGQPMGGMPTAALPQQMPKAVQGALPGR